MICKSTENGLPSLPKKIKADKTEKSKEGDWSLPDATTVNAVKNIVNFLEPCPDPDATALDGDSERVNKYSCSGLKFSNKNANKDNYTNISYVQSYKGSNGLQLCNASSSGNGGAPRCYARFGIRSCNGAKFARGDKTMGCAPGVVWMQDGNCFSLSRGYIRTNSTGYILDNEKNTVVDGASYDKTSAFSARCILKSWVE